MRAPRWICNLAGAESSLSHSLPDTMGAQVDYDDDGEMHLDENAEEQLHSHSGETEQPH